MPRRPTTGAVLSAVIGLTLAACGGEENVSRDVQRALPTVQGTLLAQLCDPLDPALRQPMSSRRRAQRQMRALLAALAATPEARVPTRRMTHDGDVREELSVRELAERHRAGLSEIVQTAGRRAQDCARAGSRQLRVALERA